MADHQHDHPNDGGVHVHVHSWKLYAAILGALLVLTVVTVAVSYVDVDGLLSLGRGAEGVGAWNLGIAIVIATVKATLVVLFFMHLKDDKRFNGLFFLGSLLFVGVFLAYTMNDTHYRGLVGDRYNGVAVDPDTGVRAPGGIDGPIPGQVLEEGLTAPAEAEPAAVPAPAPLVDEPGAVENIVDEILGEEADEAVEGAEANDEILGEDAADPEGADPEAGDPEGAEDALPVEEAAPAPVEEAPAEVIRRPRPRRAAPAGDTAGDTAEAPSQPEPEPEEEAAE